MSGRIGIILVVAMALASCDRSAPAPGKHPRVASLAPGATDLILGMGAGDHLVGVSNFDTARDEINGLPRVGDYQGLDWEKLAPLKPDMLIVFMAPDRMPQAMRERAGKMGMKLVNVRTERLDDVYTELGRLGELLGEKEKAAAAEKSLREKMEAVRKSVAGRPKVRVLVAREANSKAVVGRGTFIDDVLEIAGGENVVEEVGWPELDRERVVSLRPEVIVHLLPGASGQVKEQMRAEWGRLDMVPAVKNGRVYIIDDWWAQQPGMHLADLAEKLAGVLHGSRP
jgi:iron complex transport system substrate-binding protein